MAIVSVATIALGVIIPLAFAAPFFLLLIPAGIALGVVSKSSIKKSKGKLKGNGLAAAAIISGLIYTLLFIVLVVEYAAGGM